MYIPKGFKKEYKWRKQGGARFAGIPTVPSNDPKHDNAGKDWLEKLMSDIKKAQTAVKS